MFAIVAGSIAFFVALWLFIGFVVGTTTRWRLLARDYPSHGIPDGTPHRRGSLVVGGARFRGAITYTPTGGGLDARLHWVFGVGNRPWRVPWDKIRARDEPRRRNLVAVTFVTRDGSFDAWIPAAVWDARPRRG
jgi:hypothetical protein